MSEPDDPFLQSAASKMLAAMDLTQQLADQEKRHRRELHRLFGGLLEVVDSLETLEAHCRSLVDAGASAVPARSVSLLLKQFRQQLTAAGVESVPGAGHPLNLDMHEVLTTRPAAGSEQEGIVLEETLKGYTLRGRLLRRARVIVASHDQIPPTEAHL